MVRSTSCGKTIFCLASYVRRVGYHMTSKITLPVIVGVAFLSPAPTEYSDFLVHHLRSNLHTDSISFCEAQIGVPILQLPRYIGRTKINA